MVILEKMFFIFVVVCNKLNHLQDKKHFFQFDDITFDFINICIHFRLKKNNIDRFDLELFYRFVFIS